VSAAVCGKEENPDDPVNPVKRRLALCVSAVSNVCLRHQRPVLGIFIVVYQQGQLGPEKEKKKKADKVTIGGKR